MFLETFQEGPCRFPPCIPHHTPICHILPVGYSTFLCDVIPILGSHQEVFDGAASLEVNLDPNFATNVLKLLFIPLV